MATGRLAGGQIGGSAWMLAGAVVLVRRDPSAALALAGAFLAVNVVGVLLWRARDRIAPNPAIQAQLAVLFVAYVVTLVTLHARGHGAYVDPGRSPWRWYLMLLLFPAASIMFWRQNRPGGARRYDHPSA